jgi:hypothetical protein
VSPTEGARICTTEQGGFAGGTCNQLERMDALGLACVLEENQSGVGKGAVSFRLRGPLNVLGHARCNPNGIWTGGGGVAPCNRGRYALFSTRSCTSL